MQENEVEKKLQKCLMRSVCRRRRPVFALAEVKRNVGFVYCSEGRSTNPDVRNMANSSYTIETPRGQEPGQGKLGRLACGATAQTAACMEPHCLPTCCYLYLSAPLPCPR